VRAKEKQKNNIGRATELGCRRGEGFSRLIIPGRYGVKRRTLLYKIGLEGGKEKGVVWPH